MKTAIPFLIIIFCLSSCSSSKNVDTENLPKDIALKPRKEETHHDPIVIIDTGNETVVTLNQLEQLNNEIETLINSKMCDDASKWRISPLGAKPCGGPTSYIAYPKELENEVMNKITKYNSMSALYNKQNGLMSDCALVPPPSGIKCENGKPVLEKAKPSKDIVEIE